MHPKQSERVFSLLLEIKEQIDQKFDKMEDRLDSLDRNMERNTTSLEVHEQRTTVAEANHEMLRKDVAPIRKHVDIVEFCVKALTALGGLGVLGYLLKLFV
jgi:tetrahydromethanopterin S-methyltransferase subunit B